MKKDIVTSHLVPRTSYLVLLLFFVLTACHDYEEPYVPKPEQHPQRTLLMFLPWADDLQWAFNSNIAMMEKNIKENHGLQGQRLLVFRSTSETDATLVEIFYDRDSCYHDTLQVYSNFKPMTVKSVLRVLTDMKAFAPSETDRYAMLMGCHGSGWLTTDSWYGAKSNLAPRTSHLAPRMKTIGGRTLDSQMDISDFAEGIRSADVKFDFIVFDDCYIAGIETAYDLREVTTWLVASTCEMMDYGLPYDRMFTDLTAITPRWDAAMQQFYDFYSSYSIPCGTFSAIDCREVEAIATLMRQANSLYTFDEAQLDDLQALDGMKKHIFFDMGDYVSHLIPPTSNLLPLIQEQLERLVPSKTHTETFYSKYSWMPIPIHSYSGITISDPTINAQAIHGVEHTAWWKATHAIQASQVKSEQ